MASSGLSQPQPSVEGPAGGTQIAGSGAHKSALSRFSRAGILIYGYLAYLLGVLALTVLIAFVAGLGPKGGIDRGPSSTLLVPAALNGALVLLFSLQHSLMARRPFKRLVTRVVPKAAERSTYVVFSGLALLLLCLAWRPMPQVVWHVRHPLAVGLAWGVFAYGWLLMIWSTFLISHDDLFGLRQVRHAFSGQDPPPVPFQVHSAYRLIRNPMMLGILLGLWATPRMTAGHLLLASLMTVYIGVGVIFEQRSLAHELGEPYRRYLKQVPAFLPNPWRRRRRRSDR